MILPRAFSWAVLGKGGREVSEGGLLARGSGVKGKGGGSVGR